MYDTCCNRTLGGEKVEIYRVENLTFTYPLSETAAIKDIFLTVKEGELVTICGKSGCGKSTLLRHLKQTLAPHGVRRGEIYFMDRDITSMDFRNQSEKIGFVLQNPDSQIVTDKVWHEIAFGMESMGVSTTEIRSRTAEMASFFGIQTWFHKNVNELSGGQKQLLNLAAVMAMQPLVLLLDEPTSQLDPIAAQEFLDAVSKINRELGITVILTEHRLEEAFAISDRIIVMDNGKIIADDIPKKIGVKLKNHDIFTALPTTMRVYEGVEGGANAPVTVREGRQWLNSMANKIDINPERIERACQTQLSEETVIELKDVFFRYEKELPDVLCGLSVNIARGEIYAIVGGNGTGKTTALSVISGLNKPYRGNVHINGKNISEFSNLYDGIIGVLPQNPQTLFVKTTVRLDLTEILSDKSMSKDEKNNAVNIVSKICEIDNLLDRHPYDLSGGEQQRAALAKILLLKPQILLLDEPTKGMDAHFKEKLAHILYSLKTSGVTIVLVSHDIEFCVEHSDRCAMFFDGNVVSEDSPRRFFSGKCFYTTAANRMARHILPDAVLAEDIISACGAETGKKEGLIDYTDYFIERETEKQVVGIENCPRQKGRIIAGIVFALMFIGSILLNDRLEGYLDTANQLLSIIFPAISLSCFMPKKILGRETDDTQILKRRLSRRNAVSVLMILLAVPITIYAGIYFFGDRKYYFISLLIIIEMMVPFVLVFEERKPLARELVVISVLCAIGVAGRSAFYMLPQFKPLIAIVIISGVCFGAETGFLVGAVTCFVSNFFFGQGPWTPWQMFAVGIIGFAAGMLFRTGLLRKTRGSLCIFGGLATIIIYGGIINPASVIMWQSKPTLAMLLSSYTMGLPFDLIHAAATIFFLWFVSEPMIEKMDRIKIKYGIIS